MNEWNVQKTFYPPIDEPMSYKEDALDEYYNMKRGLSVSIFS
jgi:hypothetical protein